MAKALGKVMGLSATAAITCLVFLAGFAGATGSGYNLAYSQAANTAIEASVDITAVHSTYTSGPNLTASMTLAGSPVLTGSSYSYYFWFGGSSQGNSSAWVFTANSTLAYLYSSASSFSSIPLTVSGDTLTVSVATSAVGLASSYAINGLAAHGTRSAATYSWLGTNYQNTGGGGTCSGASCTTTAAATSAAWWLYAVAGVVIVIVVVVVVLLVVMRKRSPPPPPAMPAPGTMPPPPPSQ
jgi:hypothetical protein